jgi:hypothetical protein
MKTPMSSIMLLTLVHEIGANNAHPNQQELDEIRQESDAPTLILMSVLAFIFIISQFMEEVHL